MAKLFPDAAALPGEPFAALPMHQAADAPPPDLPAHGIPLVGDPPPVLSAASAKPRPAIVMGLAVLAGMGLAAVVVALLVDPAPLPTPSATATIGPPPAEAQATETASVAPSLPPALVPKGAAFAPSAAPLPPPSDVASGPSLVEPAAAPSQMSPAQPLPDRKPVLKPRPAAGLPATKALAAITPPKPVRTHDYRAPRRDEGGPPIDASDLPPLETSASPLPQQSAALAIDPSESPPAPLPEMQAIGRPITLLPPAAARGDGR